MRYLWASCKSRGFPTLTNSKLASYLPSPLPASTRAHKNEKASKGESILHHEIVRVGLVYPRPSRVCDSEPWNHQQISSFKLKSHVIAPSNSTFDTLYLSPYPIGPATNYAVFVPKSARNAGIVGHLNGTSAEIESEQADLVFDLASSVSYGFVIDQIDEAHNPVEINAGEGTPGIFIDQGVIKYHNPMSGGFYACKNTLPHSPAIQIFYRPKLIASPGSCSDVELVVEYV